MRVSYFYRNNNLTEDSSYTSLIQFTSPLYLNGNPTNQMHAAPKQYVDSLFSYNLDASKIKDGKIQSYLLPTFKGDISNGEFPDTFTLKQSNIPEGTYSKVIVDTRGLVVGTFDLEESDIPMLNWAKLSTSRPSSLSGYGITDGVSLSGTTVTGNIEYLGALDGPLNPITKASLTTLTATLSDTKEPVGTIIERTVSTSVTNFLRCNGSLVSKTMYPSLYSVIGDTYTPDPSSTPEQFGLPDLYSEEVQGKIFFIRY